MSKSSANSSSEQSLLVWLFHDAREVLQEIVTSFLAPDDSASVLVSCKSLASLSHETWNTKLFRLTGKRNPEKTVKELKREFRQEFFLVSMLRSMNEKDISGGSYHICNITE